VFHSLRTVRGKSFPRPFFAARPAETADVSAEDHGQASSADYRCGALWRESRPSAALARFHRPSWSIDQPYVVEVCGAILPQASRAVLLPSKPFTVRVQAVPMPPSRTDSSLSCFFAPQTDAPLRRFQLLVVSRSRWPCCWWGL